MAIGQTITFAGPDGDYTIALPDIAQYQDAALSVVGPNGAEDWDIETEAVGTDGVVILSGMTKGKDALWFELRLGSEPEIRYWGDRVIVRTDRMPLAG